MLSLTFALIFAAIGRPQMVVTTEWLADNITHPDIRVLDVSTADEYNSGHIPGAVHLNIHRLMVRRGDVPDELPPVARLEELFREAGVKQTDHIILTSRNPLWAARAWFTLDYLGYGDRAAILDGGTTKWISERRQVKTIITPATPGDFAAAIDRHAVINIDELKTLLASDTPLVLLDARDARHFMGRIKGVEVKNAGHIERAVCFPALSNLTKEGKAQVLRTPRDLAQMYESLNITSEDQRIVVYCRTGVEASMSYFVLRYLGFHPALYDGSFVEWNKTEPVVRTGR